MMQLEGEQTYSLVRDDSVEGASDVSRGAQIVDYSELEAWVGHHDPVWIGHRRHTSCSRTYSCSDAVDVVDQEDYNCHTCRNHCDAVHAVAAAADDDYCDCHDVNCQNLGLERMASSESHPTMISAVVADLVRSYRGEHPPVVGQTAEHPSMAHPIPLAT